MVSLRPSPYGAEPIITPCCKPESNKIENSFIHCCVHRGGLQMSLVGLSFQLGSSLFIWLYRFEPVQSLRSSTHVRLGLMKHEVYRKNSRCTFFT